MQDQRDSGDDFLDLKALSSSQPASVDHVQQMQQDWEDDEDRCSSCATNVRSTPTRTTTPWTTPCRSTAAAHTPVRSPLCLPSPSAIGGAHRRRMPSVSVAPGGHTCESEYDFMEDSSEQPHETISAFRKRRLADKKYEFTDENTENVPLKVLRRRRDRSVGGSATGDDGPIPGPIVVASECSAKDWTDDWEWNLSWHSNDVLRPFNCNIPTPPSAGVRSPSSSEHVDDQQAPWLSAPASGPPSALNNGAPGGGVLKATLTPNCVVQFQRRYFEVDDELVSVITDIEGYYLFIFCFFFN